MELRKGLYGNLNFQDYENDPAISSRYLHLLNRSPMHFRYYSQLPSSDSAAMKIGRAVHAAILEPDKFGARYIISDKPIDLRTKEGKARHTELSESGKEVLKPDEGDAVSGAINAIEQNSEAKSILRGAATELSAFWLDHEYQERCKARPDIWNERLGILADLKTTEDASYAAFRATFERLGYWRKAAWYRHGLRALGLTVNEVVFICVETKPPHGATCYVMDSDSLRLGELECRELLKKYSTLKRLERWPGYPSIQDMGLRSWAKKEIEERYGETRDSTNGVAETSSGSDIN